MKTFLSSFLIIVLSLAQFTQSDAADRYARKTGNWNAPDTWSSTAAGTDRASLPVAGDAVTIARGFTVTVNVNNAACASIQLGATTSYGGKGELRFNDKSQLTVSGSVTLGGSPTAPTLAGTVDMTNGGTLICASIRSISPDDDWFADKGTVRLTAANTLPAQTVISFYNLIVDGETTLGACITVEGKLTLSNGNLVSGATKMLTLGQDATISGGSSASFVQGPMRVSWKAATAAKLFPLGKTTYEPLMISLTTPNDPVIQAECFDAGVSGALASPLTMISSSHYYRTSLVTGTANKGGSVTIPNNSDIPASASSLVVAASAQPSETITCLRANSGSSASVTSAGYYPALTSVLVLGTTDGTLPVELTKFTASARKGGIVLSWATATEINNVGFEVQRRSAGSDWQALGFVEGSGSSSVQHQYSYNDAAAPAGISTYRLKQIDRDGAYEYSAEVEASAALTPGEYALAQNYPNPFNPTTNIRFAVARTQQAELKIFNMLGQEVKTLFNGIAEGGVMQMVQFDAAGLSSGLYLYRLQTAEKTEVKRMMLLR